MKMLTRKMQNHLCVALAAAGCLSAAGAFAEQADRTKQIEIVFDMATLDQNKRVRNLEGNVVLTQGTMRFSAERMVVKEDEAGNMSAMAFGSAKGQVSFRQKREGATDFIEGFADRAEFDDQTDTLKLLSRARLKSGGDELKGEYIYYNSATEVMQIRNAIPDAKGTVTTGNGTNRPTITIQPKLAEEKPRQTAPAKTN
jgi:lipopolysaccharide export system protein LptA